MMQIIKHEAMSRTDLADNGIFFFECLDHYEVPDSVHILRESLLDFFCTVIDRLGIQKDQEFEHPNNLLQILDESERTHIKSIVEQYGTTRSKALDLQRGQDREREWVNFFYKYFFSPLASSLDIAKSDSRWYMFLLI